MPEQNEANLFESYKDAKLEAIELAVRVIAEHEVNK
jgi:hypothetical protein